MAEWVLNAENFDAAVLRSDRPVLVDFWATWCGPCRMMAPVVSEIAAAYADTLTVGKVNVDEEEALSVRYGIDAIPALILFRDGQPVAQSVGYRSPEELKAWLEEVL